MCPNPIILAWRNPDDVEHAPKVFVRQVPAHPAHRNKGLAVVCSSHVLASVGRAGIRRVVLNVEDQKAGARRVYEGLGFRTACSYLDGECGRIPFPSPGEIRIT
jgi:GNAT superfamily N-acetyltransferase